MKPTITITEEEYTDLCRSAEALDWLQSRGVCWRGCDEAFDGWVVGYETEWYYRTHGDIREKIEEHKDFLSRLSGKA